MNHQSTHNEDNYAIDNELRKLLNDKLPQANENEWFTPRVMNRLPERSHWATAKIWQWVCYILGIVGLIAGIIISGEGVIEYGLSLLSLVSVLTISLLLLTCGAIIMTPTLVKMLREP